MIDNMVSCRSITLFCVLVHLTTMATCSSTTIDNTAICLPSLTFLAETVIDIDCAAVMSAPDAAIAALDGVWTPAIGESLRSPFRRYYVPPTVAHDWTQWDQRLSEVNDLYGSGNVIAWYMTVVAVVLASQSRSTDGSQHKFNIDVINMLIFPTITGVHLLGLCVSYLYYNHTGAYGLTIAPHCEDVGAIAAPVAVLTAFISVSPLLLTCMPSQVTGKPLVVLVGWLLVTAPYSVAIFLMPRNSMWPEIEPILTFAFSTMSVCSSCASLRKKNRLNARPNSEGQRANQKHQTIAFCLPRSRNDLYEMLNIWAPVLALVLCKLVKIFSRNAYKDAQYSKWIWPTTKTSIFDFDQMFALISGAVVLIWEVYLAYCGHEKREHQE